MEKYHRNPAQFHEIGPQSSSENATVNGGSDSDEADEVMFCQDHCTKRLDRVCMTCKRMMCVLCDEASTHTPEHCVMLLPNKCCIKHLQQHLQDDLTSVQHKLNVSKETLEKTCQSESDAYKEFRQLEDTILRSIREIFLRKERDFLEILRGKHTALTTQCDVLKANVKEMTSLTLRIQSGHCNLSDILQTFSSLNLLSSLAAHSVKNRVDDHEDSDFNELREQKLTEAVMECQVSLESKVFSRKRKIEGKEDAAFCPETGNVQGKSTKRKSMDTSPYSKHNSEFKEGSSLSQSQEISSPKDFETESAELSIEFPADLTSSWKPSGKEDLQAVDADQDSVIYKNPDPRSIQAEGNPCSSNEATSYEVSGNLAVDKDLVIVDDETLTIQYPNKDEREKEVATITAGLPISQQSNDDQNTESTRDFPNDHDDTTSGITTNDASDVNRRYSPSDDDDDTTNGVTTLKPPPLMYRNPPTITIINVDEDSLAGNQMSLGECSCTTTTDESANSTSNDRPQNNYPAPQMPRRDVEPTASYETKWIRTIGSKGKNSGEFNEPEGLAVGPNGNIYVADSLNNRIQVFNSDLEFVISFGKTRPGLLKKPFDVTVYTASDASRDVSEVNRNVVVVADTYNNKLQFFWGDGKFLDKFGRKGRNPQQFEGPNCVCVNSKGHVVVTDSDNHRIHVIAPNGQEDHVVFGNKGDGFKEFCNPVGVATDDDDNIIVADYGNNRIKMLSPTGETIKTFGRGLSRPSHVAVSPRGNIFVSDSGNHRIQIYDKDGRYVESFGSMGTDPGCFHEPGGITWLPNGRLVVSDVTNCRLQIFDCPY